MNKEDYLLFGNDIDEIRNLPDTYVYRRILASIEQKLQNGVITKDNALDMGEKLCLDYRREKKEIVESIKQNEKIIIIDSIMGSGKSTYVIDRIINESQISSLRFLCILPTLDECERYAKRINGYVFAPRKYGSKMRDFKTLISEQKKNIVITHALIQYIDEETIDLLRKANYTLIIDECLDVVHKYEKNFKKSDFDTMIKNYITVDENGFFQWNDADYNSYDGRFNDIRNLCKMHSLMFFKKKNGEFSKIIMWNFPTVFFTLFRKCYICTYLWNGSIQKAYFDLHHIKYVHMTLCNNELTVYNPTKEAVLRRRYLDLINFCHDRKLNEIGMPEKHSKGNPLSKTWYQNKVKNNRMDCLKKLKNNTYNYFRNKVKTPSEDNMYSVFEDYKKYIEKDSYKNGFVACNIRATNEYTNKKSLAYLIDVYPNVELLDFFASYGVTIDKDLYAVSQLLQWIWRSQIRNNKSINLYLPSIRMKELLGNWGLGKL